MHVDKVMIEEEEGPAVDMDGAALEDVESQEVPESGVESGVLISNDTEKNEEDSAEPVEYEYVSLSDVTNGWAASLKDFAREHFVPIACIAIVILCLLILGVGRRVNSVLIAVGFVFIMVIFGIALYFAWNERKEAQRKYEYAKKVQELVRDKVMEDYEEEQK